MKLWGRQGVQLVLEITERSLMNSRPAFEILSRIRELGAKVSIDDFGTGYSPDVFTVAVDLARLRSRRQA